MNTTQAAVLQSLDANNNSLAEILAVLQRDGGVIVHNMLSDQVLQNLRNELIEPTRVIAPGSRAQDPTINPFWGLKTKRFTRLAWRSRTFADSVLVHPIMLGVADEVLLPRCASYWMNTGQMMIIGPGEKAQYLHRDSDNWKYAANPQSSEATVSCMFAVSDFTAENGATRVVPGSHLWDDFSREATEDQIVQAVMPAGSGLIYSGNVIHSGGANITTDIWRHGLHLSYVLGWLTPEEAGCIGVTDAVAQTLTPLQQKLLGYRCYTGDAVAGRLWTVDYEDVPVGLNW